MKIYGFSAKAEHGKTFAANVALKHFTDLGYKVRIIPLAETLKDMAYKVGWDGRKNQADENGIGSGRTLLQELGRVLKRYHKGDCFARWAYEKAVNEGLDIMLIDDMRMLDEVKFFEDLLASGQVEDYKLFRIDRPGHENALTQEQRADISETALDDYKFDAVLINDGTSQFNDKVLELFN